MGEISPAQPGYSDFRRSTGRSGPEEANEHAGVDAGRGDQVVDRDPFIGGVGDGEGTGAEDHRGDSGLVQVVAGIGDAAEADGGRWTAVGADGDRLAGEPDDRIVRRSLGRVAPLVELE